MKEKYKWYLRLSDEEISNIWENGILTIDANVALDLYRYHEQTRENLLSALRKFNGRLWFSDQASIEFIRNRNTVIASSEKTFKDAFGELDKLKQNSDSSIAKLKGQRLVPRPMLEELESALNASLEKATLGLEDATDKHPNYFDADPILDEILSLFDGSVGEDFHPDEAMIKEANRRIEECVPPGYLDAGKDGERSYGDFFVWNQVLEHAKQTEKPMILVTSEQKKDWWEKPAGKTCGPRLELLREAFSVSGQRILIYQTDYFLKLSAERSGENVDEQAVNEIRDINSERELSRTETALVSVNQSITLSSLNLNEGKITITIIKPVFKITGSGKFDPRMSHPPMISIRLIECPDNMPKFHTAAGTGTNFDFNIHIKSDDYGVFLPEGKYVFGYSACCEQESSTITAETHSNQELQPTVTTPGESDKAQGTAAEL